MATPEQRTLVLAPDLTSVTSGRHFARDVLLEWNLPQLVDDAQLGTSELVTNAVKHARTDLLLTVRLDRAVTIEVQDHHPELRRPLPGVIPDATAESGRGLQIVAAISDDWGVTARADGKCVWFRLRLPDEHAADADLLSMAGHQEASRRPDRVAAPDRNEELREQARATN